jgi:predicted GH43/DUF377 family glycosyl hydrolase
MFKRLTLTLLSVAFSQYATIDDPFYNYNEKIVINTRRYEFAKYPGSFNPSLYKIDTGFILTFRYCPDEQNQHWVSYIGIIKLDESLNPIGSQKLLNTRPRRTKTPSQAEDGRIFSFNDKVYMIYNDNVDTMYFHHGIRRDMFMVELIQTEEGYQLSAPLKLIHEENYSKSLHQKNWVPFQWENTLQFSYSLAPHVVLTPSLRNGVCTTTYTTEPELNWKYGNPRGSTPPILVDGEYLAFFHSSYKTKSETSYDQKMWHYFMGAYTFSAQPPFEITKISDKPIMDPSFYTRSYRNKRVVFPGGFVVSGPRIHVAYGKDDCEIWIATLDKEELMKSLVPIKEDVTPLP